MKAAFDDAVPHVKRAAVFVKAEAYTNEVQPRANGQAQRILEEHAPIKRTITEAQGEVARFAKILPE